MTGSSDEEILKAAGKINDGEQTHHLADKTSTNSNHDILAALQKIDRITRNIRKHGKFATLQMKSGDHWAHLQITEKIGHGGIGEVYCAYDPILDSQVAVKFLSKKSQLYISQQQFLDEARYMATVRHPHVLAIHGATIDQNIAGYWSDYLDGTLLSEQLANTPLNWPQILKFANQLTQAVTAIHNNQLVHGDIKSLNVMLQPERGAILLDFGSSRKNDTKSTEAYIQQASPMAMAPEQFLGEMASQATDVFTLGLVFWHMSAEAHPLADMALNDIKQNIGSLSSLQHKIRGPKAWRQLILSMVQTNPSDRPHIHSVARTINKIISSPARKAKRIAITSLLSLAAGITLISLYSNYKTTQAQKETQAMNTILSNILMKSSPIESGKDVLLVDVLAEAETLLINNHEISKKQRSESLLQLVRTYRHQGKHQMAIDLATQLLADKDLSSSHRLDLLMQKSAGLNENKNYQESEALLLEAIKIKPVSDQDATAQLSALITLIYTYNESYQLDKVPPLIAQAKTLWQRSAKKEAALANIYLVEGNHYEIKEQFAKAYDFYQLSIQNFTTYYGEKNLDTLIAMGAAATVLTYDTNTINKGITELESVVKKMTGFLGEEHSSTLIARINLADAYSQTGNHLQAIDTIVPFMPYVYQVYGPDGGMTLTFKNMIAGYYQKNGDWVLAEQTIQEIIASEKLKHGDDSQQHIEARLNLVIFYTESKKLTAAVSLAQNLLQIAGSQLPVQHRLTLDIEEHLIWSQHLQGQPDAVDRMDRLVQTKTTVLGADDPSTLSAGKHLAAMKH